MTLEQIVGALIIAALCWVATVLVKVSKELIEWRVILFGPPPDYKNGMRGIQKDHENRIRALEDAA